MRSLRPCLPIVCNMHDPTDRVLDGMPPRAKKLSTVRFNMLQMMSYREAKSKLARYQKLSDSINERILEARCELVTLAIAAMRSAEEDIDM